MGIDYYALVYCDKHGQNVSISRIFGIVYLGLGMEHYDAAIDHHKVHRYVIGVSLAEKEDMTAC